MNRVRHIHARLGLAAALTVLAVAPAAAFERLLDPDTLPPQEREFALHGPLGHVGPDGLPADQGCLWSRLQMPTMTGLRWMAVEECGHNYYERWW